MVLKKRFHQIELFLKYPMKSRRTTFNLLQKAKQTEIGRQYDFASINSWTLQSGFPLPAMKIMKAR